MRAHSARGQPALAATGISEAALAGVDWSLAAPDKQQVRLFLCTQHVS